MKSDTISDLESDDKSVGYYPIHVDEILLDWYIIIQNLDGVMNQIYFDLYVVYLKATSKGEKDDMIDNL